MAYSNKIELLEGGFFMTPEERIANHAAWVEKIADFRASGLSGEKWCAINNQKTNRLWYWLKKLDPQQEASVRWLPVDLSDPGPALTIRIGPAMIEVRSGFDPQLLVKVVKTVSAI